jgi:hypothetical protein
MGDDKEGYLLSGGDGGRDITGRDIYFQEGMVMDRGM